MFACNAGTSSCPATSLEGKDAIAAIRAKDSLIPETFITVPDKQLASSTREVEAVLDQLAEAGLLQYRLTDSLPGKRSLGGTEETLFYQYAVDWSPTLEPETIQQAERDSVTTITFFGKQLAGEVRFSSRKFLAGEIRIEGSMPLFYKEDCQGLAYKYTYSIDSTNALARIAGMNPYIKSTRAVTTTVSYN